MASPTGSSKGIEHVVSVETYGPKRKTILATTPQGVTLGTPLPDLRLVVDDHHPQGEIGTAESTHRDDAVVTACEQVGVDPVRQLGRAGVQRVLDRRAA